MAAHVVPANIQLSFHSMSTLLRTALNDFVVFNTGDADSSGASANIVAFNNLYSTQGSVGGLCNQDGPSVYWSYFNSGAERPERLWRFPLMVRKLPLCKMEDSAPRF